MILTIVVSLLPIALGCVLIAGAFVAFVRWTDRLGAAESFVDQFIPELEDVAAIEASLPKFGDPR